MAAQQQEQTINTMIEDREKLGELNKGLQKDLQTAEKYGDQLRNTLRKHNLTHLANKRPSYIERKMQNATNRLWDCLADITDPDRVQSEDRTKSSNCHKGSKDRNQETILESHKLPAGFKERFKSITAYMSLIF